jgi:hypothetical protein
MRTRTPGPGLTVCEVGLGGMSLTRACGHPDDPPAGTRCPAEFPAPPGR